MSVTNPTTHDRLRWICNTSAEEGIREIQTLLKAHAEKPNPDLGHLLLDAQAYEIHGANRASLKLALKRALKKLGPIPAKIVTKAEFTEILDQSVNVPAKPDPAWDQVRQTSDQLRACGRMFLRGQVKLGMLLAALKKECGIHAGQPKKNSPESGQYLPWADLVKRETGYSRQSCDEFIRLAEATKAKLKTAKKLQIPAPVKKDAIALFRSENPLILSDEQWSLVDQVIGSLTNGETQASLMEELGIISKTKPMPKGSGRKKNDELTAGQLAFHFFEAMTEPFVNGRHNPDYKKLLYALPLVGTPENPLSIAMLETEFRAVLADIEELKQSAAKPARGRTL